MQPALFLDRDGVIIENRADYVKSIAEVSFIPGVLAALAEAAQHPVRVVVVTNQSAVGRGLISLATVEQVNAHIAQHIAAHGGRIDRIYICPHRPDEMCLCRKPAPGMLLQAARELDIDLAASILIGDNASDVGAARAAGVRPILVRTGLGATQELAALGSVTHYPDLPHALAALWPTFPRA
jgi:D-glycero-D-manno-heptose 1,7-bisphosphate phosphatase